MLTVLAVTALALCAAMVGTATPVGLAITFLLTVLLQATLATSPRVSASGQACYAAGALLTCGTVLVTTSGGRLETHLTFLFILCVITLYHRWTVYLGAVGYLAVYYLLFGSVRADWLLHDVAATGSHWPAVLFASTVAPSLVVMVGWALAADVSHQAQQLQASLADAGLRERHAQQLNDTVLQHLATAIYAADAGATSQAADSARRAMDAARSLVRAGQQPRWLKDPTPLVRTDASQPAGSAITSSQSTSPPCDLT